MADYDALRETMVDTQIRPSDVTKYTVIDAMLSVPREAYVPRERRQVAYVGDHVALDTGRVVMDPRVLAKMLDLVDIQNDELVLDIGSGLGYSAAVIARMAEAVVAVEDDEDRVSEAQTILSEQGADNVILHQGELSDGASAHGPYDVITIQGAVETLPESILAQLKEGGRIVCLFQEGALGIVRIGYLIDGQINWRFAFNAGAPVLPGFEKHRVFKL
ncbi:protein-L-isoaspartate O-methyltransferase [Shimia thalassica]|jgi:protein-L-isoaspartate(D-aspartate) O-methyltransferase|uniref:Protein-L-isoaspartate O-methyltransferase n=1 Tax=Shimia thalassica TaxID=1715693 RepID=A0A0N7M8E2_9RHOB|nr:protein-L-isoaspartate O-methyltransferase [Shimia thalassica]PHO02884.1 protein-L-isoaspartate O-methyltransferase [Rhodobacteraceae bacterium 4F10]MBU2943081.1 protein-L-isoaspartate O-methyltransferase [Shimia thalassica]MDO6479054.1 protein-L-isoaspartate O-methyltransferase [Shimia thalassica]MDO6482096.1 protein-L-isoaspartate O-methyltransferase [Shimia thalassica]MDO6502596.1 protein-L-isoaspartate O-methyltransferase [Shimia thalassica]